MAPESTILRQIRYQSITRRLPPCQGCSILPEELLGLCIAALAYAQDRARFPYQRRKSITALDHQNIDMTMSARYYNDSRKLVIGV